MSIMHGIGCSRGLLEKIALKNPEGETDFRPSCLTYLLWRKKGRKEYGNWVERASDCSPIPKTVWPAPERLPQADLWYREPHVLREWARVSTVTMHNPCLGMVGKKCGLCGCGQSSIIGGHIFMVGLTTD